MDTLTSTDATVEQAAWEPESPFLRDVPVARAATPSMAPARADAASFPAASPFVSEYAGGDAFSSPQAEAFASIVGELHDPEMDEAIGDLVHEAAAIAADRTAGEVSDPGRDRQEMERAVEEYLEPLRRRAERAIERVAEGLGARDVSGLSADELESLVDQLAPVEPGLTAVQENFLGKLVKKVKKAVGKVTKFMPHNLLLGKLKGLVKPLLDKVLRVAIDKLPVAIRPVAKQLAAKFLRVGETVEGEELAREGEPAAADPRMLQQELDTQIAGYLTQGEDFEDQVARVRTLALQGVPRADALHRLAHARGRFARRIVALREDEDPRPVVEEFVPAILAALKMGINVVGRPKVVKFLAGMVSKLISKYVGQQQAGTLSTALVDTGLRMMTLEARPEGQLLAAGQALAATVEETTNTLVQTVPEVAWESETVLEGYVHEAFERAAAANFPDSLIRPELHEAAEAAGLWEPLPRGSARTLYKKYTKPIEAVITPQAADRVTSFRGIPLRAFLRDRMGVNLTRPMKVRVHLYEAVPGTTLSLISKHETGVPGLMGSARREAWSQIHPLTPEAAAAILREPGLGRAVRARFLASRDLIDVHQRFYYLELPGVPVQVAPREPGGTPRPARSSETRVVVDLPKRELRVYVYYSEHDAQSLAKQMRGGLPISAVMTALRARLDVNLAKIFTGDPTSGIRIIHEAAPTEQYAGPVLAAVGSQVGEFLLNWMLEAFKRELETRYAMFAADFEKVANQPADGATVIITFRAPALIEAMRKLLKPGGMMSAPMVVFSLVRQVLSDYQLQLRAGSVFA